MRTLVNHQQTRLFDPFDGVLTPRTRQRLLDGWPGVFRYVMLELMPADALAKHFDPTMGRPSKELYSMAGLIFLAEYFNWTKDEALDAYCFHMDVHYALNLEPVAQELSMRTLERNIARFKDVALAEAVMADVTVRLVEHLGIKVDKQRLEHAAGDGLRQTAENRVRTGKSGRFVPDFYDFTGYINDPACLQMA